MPTIGLLLLAAGSSSRMGRPKQLEKYQGVSLLRRAAQTAVASACQPIMVVLGAEADHCLPEIDDLPLSSVENHAWSEGMGSSLHFGLEALLKASSLPLDAVLIMLCDQPLLTVSTLSALIREYEATSCRIVASEYGESLGVPALFDRSLFPELLALAGTQGAKQILHRYPDQIHKIAFEDGALDIDTAADLTRLANTF